MMSNYYDDYFDKVKENAKSLCSNMTVHERILWSKLSNRQMENTLFYPQKAIGENIVDFYAPRINLIIELDGCQHLKPDMITKDKERDEFLKFIGLSVMRFTNFQVQHCLDLVLLDIQKYIQKGAFSSGLFVGLIMD